MSSRDKGKQSQSKDPSVPQKASYDKPVTINKWDASALKNTLDDAVKKIMKEEYCYKENFKLIDSRLFVYTLACSFSLFALAYDYFYPFPASTFVLAFCSISYFILMGVGQLFSMYFEGNTFMVALEKDEAGMAADNEWRFQSSLPRFSDKYTLCASYRKGNESATGAQEGKFEKSVACWFDDEGTLVFEKFFADVNSLHNDVKNKKDK